MKTIVQHYKTLEQAGIAAAGYIEEIIRSAVSDKGFCTIVLAGGRTPQQTYELLCEPAKTAQIPWQKCHIFWGDERWVPATHPDSNFFMARKALLSRLHIPPQNIHQIPTGNNDPETGAAMYEKHLRHFFHSEPQSGSVNISGNLTLPVFDLILLGMGPDGHTASLFPGSDALAENEKWVISVSGHTGIPSVPRITLTLPVLNQARNILFLIAGNKKREILDTFLDKPWSERIKTKYPAAHIKAGESLIWIIAEKD